MKDLEKLKFELKLKASAGAAVKENGQHDPFFVKVYHGDALADLRQS